MELLLDTICNVFGGIILMAILVVVQTQTTVGQIPKPKASELERSLDAKKLEFEVGRLAREARTLEQRDRELKQTYLATTSPHTDELLERREEFLKAIAEAGRRATDLQAARKKAGDALATLDLELRKMDGQADQNTLRLQQAEKKVRDAAHRLPKKIRLPRRHRHSASKQESYLIKDGKVYPMPGHCTATPIPGTLAKRWRPREGAGLQVKAGGQANTAFLATLRARRPGRHFISFWVCDTSASFASFQQLRSAVVKLGYEYSVSAYSQEQGLLLSPGSPPVE